MSSNLIHESSSSFFSLESFFSYTHVDEKLFLVHKAEVFADSDEAIFTHKLRVTKNLLIYRSSFLKNFFMFFLEKS